MILIKDIFKINFSKKQGYTLMVFAGLILLMIIIGSILNIGNYDPVVVAKKLQSTKLSQDKFDNYVRLVAIMTILGNTFVLGGFSIMIWWSINKKKLGLFFGFFWATIFFVNAISTPFYSVQVNPLVIMQSILHAIMFIIMFIWIAQLLTIRTRIKQSIARKGSK